MRLLLERLLSRIFWFSAPIFVYSWAVLWPPVRLAKASICECLSYIYSWLSVTSFRLSNSVYWFLFIKSYYDPTDFLWVPIYSISSSLRSLVVFETTLWTSWIFDSSMSNFIDVLGNALAPYARLATEVLFEGVKACYYLIYYICLFWTCCLLLEGPLIVP